MEERILIVRHVLELAAQRRVDDRAGQHDVHPLPDTVGPAAPPGIDQVDLRAVFGHLFAEQLRVSIRVSRHEGRAEEAGEGGDRLGHIRSRSQPACWCSPS